VKEIFVVCGWSGGEGEENSSAAASRNRFQWSLFGMVMEREGEKHISWGLFLSRPSEFEGSNWKENG